MTRAITRDQISDLASRDSGTSAEVPVGDLSARVKHPGSCYRALEPCLMGFGLGLGRPRYILSGQDMGVEEPSMGAKFWDMVMGVLGRGGRVPTSTLGDHNSAMGDLGLSSVDKDLGAGIRNPSVSIGSLGHP